eukprot:TRINITY_DN320_c0_g1_i2.p1 TRINITY_DN320_c0_g1~~TRINITY_DN320_c0_g1_i2.p1  ORF type:complete len:202 (-),score=33.60 TRINITY_DN320_c0_g1_i2:143-748(-)
MSSYPATLILNSPVLSSGCHSLCTDCRLPAASRANAHLIRTTLLVLRGRNDCRCSSSENADNTRDARESLRNLDKQLELLASCNGSVRASASSAASSSSSPMIASDKSGAKLEGVGSEHMVGRFSSGDGWPEFEGQFLLYTAGLLFALTLATNIVYRILDSIVPPDAPKPQFERLKTGREETPQQPPPLIVTAFEAPVVYD